MGARDFSRALLRLDAMVKIGHTSYMKQIN